MAAQAPKAIEFLFPLKGIHKGAGQENQPKGTSPDMMNVEGFDPSTGRARGGQRTGVSKWSRVNIGQGGKVLSLHQTAIVGSTFVTTPVLETEDFRTAAATPGEDLFTFGVGWTYKWKTADPADAPAAAAYPLDILQTGTHSSKANGAGTFGVKAIRDFPTAHVGSLLFLNYNPAGGSVWAVPIYAVQAGAFDESATYHVTAHVANGTPQNWYQGVRIDTAAIDNTGVHHRLWLDNSGASSLYKWELLYGTVVVAKVWFDIAGVITAKLNAGPNVPAVGVYWQDASEKMSASLAGFDPKLRYNADDDTFEGYLDELLGVKFAAVTAAGAGRNGVCAYYPLGQAGACQAWQIRYGTETTEVPAILPQLITSAGGYLYVGASLSHHEVGGAGSRILDNYVPSICDSDGKAYIADSTEFVRVLDLRAGTFKNLVAAADKGSVPTNPTIAVVWRNRLCLVVGINLFMSRSGVFTDWLYGQEDALSAFELNASANAGRIGAPILCVIPFQDDNLIIGTDHALYNLAGDPASSDGQLVTISESIGMYGQRAWCIDPAGVLWFVGTGGLYRMDPRGGGPQLVGAHRYDDFFAGIDRTQDLTSLVYDRDRKRVYIFNTPIGFDGQTDEDLVTTHLYYDVGLDALFPLQLPVRVGPLAAVVYDGERQDDRVMLLGGRDGYVRRFNPAALSDDGDAIESYVLIGPATPFGPFDDAILMQLDGIVGVTTGAVNVQVDLLFGNESQAAAAAANSKTLATWTSTGRQGRLLTRTRGNTFYLKLSNAVYNTKWSIESVRALATYGGIQR